MGNFLADLPLIGGLFDDSADQAQSALNKGVDLFKGLNLPGYNEYKPEDYQVSGQYDPREAQSTQIQEDPALRGQQQDYLMRLAGLADHGLSDVDQAGFEQARNLASQVSHGGTGAALQNAQARGVGGSGLEFALREQASQDAANRAQQASLQQASQSAQQRALYNQAFGGALGQVRGQDFNAGQANANILNQFNQANTAAANQGQMYNLQNRQSIGNQNAELHNNAQQYNNQLKQQAFDDAYKKAAGQAGQYGQQAQGYYAENAAHGANRNAIAGAAVKGLTGGAAGGAKVSPNVGYDPSKDQEEEA